MGEAGLTEMCYTLHAESYATLPSLQNCVDAWRYTGEVHHPAMEQITMKIVNQRNTLC